MSMNSQCGLFCSNVVRLPVVSSAVLCCRLLPIFSCHSAKLYQNNGDVLLICKAYNGRVVMQWLAERVAEVAEQNPDADDRIAPVALCMFLGNDC